MGQEKNKKNEGGEKKNNGEVVKKKEGEQNKNDGKLTVVLKLNCHCDGCVKKVVQAILSVGGVEKFTCDADSIKWTVIGKIDPVMLKEKVEQKTHKHVELILPIPNKDGEGKGDAGAGEEKKKQNREKDSKGNKGGGEDEKSKVKEPPVTTAVLKVNLCCQVSIQEIRKIVPKFKGYKDMKIDKQKDLVTVTGSMNMKDLAETLKNHLKKEVEIVPPKKEGGNGGGGNGGGKGNGKGKVKDEVGKVVMKMEKVEVKMEKMVVKMEKVVVVMK